VAAGAGDLAELGKRLKRHHDDLVARHADEERRLAYVALTRAKHVLLASGFTWDSAVKPRDVSPYLVALREFAEPDAWFVPAADAANPVTAEVRTGLWPFDPLGPQTGVGGTAGGVGRRAAVERGAALVRAAVAEPAERGETDDGRLPDLAIPARVGQWRHDVQVLLEERARLSGADAFRVELPRQLSVSQLVELQRNPAELARSIRRPVPRPPAPLARRGTAFHTWLEQRWQAQTLLDVDELPGAADDGADDADFAELRAAFERSEWATRTPAEIEVPFEMTIAGNIVRGRMDAVFGSRADGWLVVDWKTGQRPTGAAAHSAAVQLAVYRLAWARLSGIPDDELHQVRAAFHYVRSNDTVQPADLLDADGLRALVTGS
jgi:ATP-dependent DNA helicase UvrD/PcrA